MRKRNIKDLEINEENDSYPCIAKMEENEEYSSHVIESSNFNIVSSLLESSENEWVSQGMGYSSSSNQQAYIDKVLEYMKNKLKRKKRSALQKYGIEVPVDSNSSLINKDKHEN